MDPLTLAGTFATLVGLLSNFKAERSGAKLDEFMDWLREQHQDGLAQSISQNERLQVALSELLATNHDELVEKLKTITDQLSEVAKRVEGFDQLTTLVSAPSGLSPQAKSILGQMAKSGAKYVMEHKLQADIEYLLMDGGTGEIQATEPRFLSEDFASLVAGGYLRVDYTSKGTPRYYLTRTGTAAVNDA